MTEKNKYHIRISRQARNDLKSIVEYIRDILKEPSIARKYVQMMQKEIRVLEYCPQKFAIIDDETIRDLRIRKLVVKKYVIFYRIDEAKKVVKVDRILYGASNWINEL